MTTWLEGPKEGEVGLRRYIDFRCVDLSNNPVTGLLLSDFTINPVIPPALAPPFEYTVNTILLQRNSDICSDALSLLDKLDGRYTLMYVPSSGGWDYVDIFINNIGSTPIGIRALDVLFIHTNFDVSNVLAIDQDFLGPGTLLVPGPHPESFTVFLFKLSDWMTGRQDTLFAVAQSDVNPDGTWKGTIDPFTGLYTKLTVSTQEIDGSLASPYVVVAINRTTTIVMGYLFRRRGQWIFNDRTQSSEILTISF